MMRTYTGMWPERVKAFLAAAEGRHVHPATMQHFVQHQLIQLDLDGGVSFFTRDGRRILDRIHQINYRTFTPPRAIIPGKDLDLVGSTAVFARRETVKAQGLRSVHLKILKCAASHPGAVYASYLDAYGYTEIDELVARSFLVLDKLTSENYSFVNPAPEALALLEWCIGEARRVYGRVS